MNELEEYRKRNKKTLMDMAQLLEVSMNTYILWTKGINTPTPENQAKIDAMFEKEKKNK